jgi:hypothetical protein
MSTRRFVAGLALAALAAGPACGVVGAARERVLRAEIARLEREREELRRRVDARLLADPRFRGMPESPLRVGVPTSLLRAFLEKLASAVVDRVRLELTDIKAHKTGEIRKVVTLGHYDLDVTIERLEGRLRAGRPEVRFGGDEVAVALPVKIESGEGRATLHFVWDGKNVSDALCGSLDVRQDVSGRVQPETFLLRGGLALTATEQWIVASPRFPPTKVRLHIQPSAASWQAVADILGEKKGACAFVLGKIDVLALLRDLIRKGINVRLPTEKIPTLSVPIGVEPTIAIRGQPVTLAIRVGGLAITERDLWLGAFVSLRPQDEGGTAAAKPSAGGPGLSARTTPPGP